MKKNIHLGLCCLMSGLMLSASEPTHEVAIESKSTSEQLNVSHDGRIGRILASVHRVVEGLVKLIKNPREKSNIFLNVGQMLDGIMHVAANAVQKNTPLTSEEIDDMVDMIKLMNLNIDHETENSLLKHALVMHNYLRTVSAEELEAFLHRNEELAGESIDDATAILNEEDHALQSNILSSLHEMIHELFTIIQHPENPQLIGQSIADILGGIMNIAGQAIKYEYLTSKNAEETVALYIDSFSDQLTKKIKHLMLQTALNLRTETRSRSCCKTNCCNTSCCKTSCCSSSSCCKSNGCQRCCRSTTTDDESTEMTRSNCGKCNTNCGKCNSGCNSCCGRTSLTETTEEATEMTRSNCGSCGKCNTNCGKCNSGCNSCCGRTSLTETTEEATEMTRSNCGSCGKCNTNCGKCNSGCNSCCGRTSLTDTEAIENQDLVRSVAAVIANCSTDCMCDPCECTAENRTARCGCGKKESQKPKPQTTATRDVQDEINEEAQPSRCSCGKKQNQKPKPAATNTRNAQEDTTNEQAQPSRCNCGKKQTQPAKITVAKPAQQ